MRPSMIVTRNDSQASMGKRESVKELLPRLLSPVERRNFRIDFESPKSMKGNTPMKFRFLRSPSPPGPNKTLPHIMITTTGLSPKHETDMNNSGAIEEDAQALQTLPKLQSPDSESESNFDPKSALRKLLHSNDGGLGALHMGNAAQKQSKKRLDTPASPGAVERNTRTASDVDQEFVGPECPTLYYMNYKNLDRIIDKDDLLENRHSPQITFLEASRSMQLLPRRNGIIKELGNENELEIGHLRIGDKYLAALAKTMKENGSGFRKIHARDNAFSPDGVKKLLRSLPLSLNDLDLSMNPIGDAGLLTFAATIKSAPMLQCLQLENCKLTDKGLITLLDSLLDGNSLLTILNLSYNQITKDSCSRLQTFIKLSDTIREVYVRWNLINSKGGATIAEALVVNNTMVILDLSWNRIGGSAQNAKKWRDAIAVNNKLIHLDLSNNYFNQEEAQLIATGLEENRTIRGFHFHGNCGYVDHKGFLRPIAAPHRPINMISLPHRINGLHVLRKVEGNNRLQEPKYLDNCWICEGWELAEFVWKSPTAVLRPKSPTTMTTQVTIHFEHESFKPIVMATGDKQYIVRRMMPRCEIRYFFTINGRQAIAEDQPKKKYAKPHQKDLKYGDKYLDLFLPLINYRKIEGTFDFIDDIKAEFEIEPRQADPEVKYPLRLGRINTPPTPNVPQQPAILQEKKPWSRDLSMFQTCRKEPETNMKDCFEFDWSHSKIPRALKPELCAKVKDVLLKHYRYIREGYRYYSSLSAKDEHYFVDLDQFTVMAKSCGFTEEYIHKMITAHFWTTVTKVLETGEKVEEQVADLNKRFARHEFMEIFMLLAVEKFVKTKEYTNVASAVNSLLEKFFLPFFKTFEPAAFREKQLWTEDIDHLCRTYLQLINELFRKYAGRDEKGHEIHTVTIHALLQMCKEGQLFADVTFEERDFYVMFAQTAQWQIDEINQHHHLALNYLEFIELLGRIAEKYSPLPMGQIVTLGQIATDEDWGEKRHNQPLHIKFESLLQLLQQRCLIGETKPKVMLPTISIFKSEDKRADATPIVSIRPAGNPSQPTTLRGLYRRGSIDP